MQVIQRRGNFSRPNDYFFKDWSNYKKGFGDLEKDFWLGNFFVVVITYPICLVNGQDQMHEVDTLIKSKQGEDSISYPLCQVPDKKEENFWNG